jgi:hypothetical protein
VIGVIASPKLSAAPSTAEVMVPYADVDNQTLVWKVVPLMTAVIVYVVLIVSSVGVPLMVHVLLSMDRPVGREGETVQVAPVTSIMLPEPLLGTVLESQVLLPETKTGVC